MKILKFSSKDCGACKIIAPMVRRVCEAHNVALEEIDVDEEPEVIEIYGIQSLPTLVKVVLAEAFDARTGLISEAEFTKWIEE